jgi:hypothetical protein
LHHRSYAIEIDIALWRARKVTSGDRSSQFSIANHPLHIIMTLLHIRVLELRTNEAHTRMNKLLLLFETRSSNRSFRGDVRGEGFLQCDGVWTFSVLNQSSESLAISLKRRRFFTSDDAIAKCALPLTWFPTNHMVREWFPMVADNDPAGSDIRAMIQLDVHVDTRAAAQFMAAFSNLRIVPSWPRPSDPGDESPAPPQVVFVVADPPTEPGGAVTYRPIGSAQYPEPGSLQAGVISQGYGSGVFAPPSGARFAAPPVNTVDDADYPPLVS